MKKIKVLFTIGNLDVGGAEKLIINQVKNIDRSKFEPHLCTLFPYGKSNYVEVFRGLPDVPYHQFAFKGPFDVSNWIAVYKLLKKEKFDLLCTHLFESNFIIRTLNLITGKKPVFIFEHNIYWQKSWWKILADKILAKQTAKIFVDSHAILNFTSNQEKITKSQFAILPYPIELVDHKTFDLQTIKQSLGLPPHSFVVTSVGRFVEQKGQTYLIQSAPEVLKKVNRDDVYFLLVGYGNMEFDLRMLADDLKLNQKLLISPTRDIKEILAISDMFIISSLWEGQPIAMLEAMAAGIPVVATKVGGIPEIMIDGENGILVEPKDPESLAKGIITLVGNEQLRKKISAEAKEVVVNYSMPVYIKKLEEYFIAAYDRDQH